jgi:thiamine transport system ATP-binding protein
MLSIRDLRVLFGDTVAVDGVSLDVDDGQTVALLGPSGSGKTTLLRVVAGLQEASSGEVRLDGRDLLQVPVHRRELGLMFQDYALFPHRDVAGNVEFGLRMRGDPLAKRRVRVDDVLRLVGLDGFGERSVATLSGGERQRVALARAIAPEPSLLMLDEPLGALDRSLRERLVLDLAELFARLSLTVLYVTHDQGEALALADRVAVMDAGRVLQDGPPEEVWARPRSPEVARFLGLANLFPSTATLPGLAARPASDGTVLVRPDAVHLAPVDGAGRDRSGSGSGGAPASDGWVGGTVDAVVFRGDHAQVWVELDGGVRLESRVAGEHRPRVGDQVRVRIDPAGVLAV